MPDDTEQAQLTQTRYQFVQLHHAGSLPGIPGSHGPGTYVIDWQDRTLHEASSLEAYLVSLDIAPIDAQEAPETAQQEDAAITPTLPEMPAGASVAQPETDVVPSAQQDEGTSALDNDAPMAVGGTEQTESIAPEGA